MKLLVTFLSIVAVASATTVLTKHGNNLLPSSTLRWKHVVIANLKHAIQVDPSEYNSMEPQHVRYVCRSFHHGQWVPGYMEKGMCFIPWEGMEHGFEQYDILVAIQGSAKMRWKKWTAREELPRLSVSTSSYYVTRHWDDAKQRYVTGKLSERNHAAHAFLRGTINNTLNTGHILTEIEPIKYELEDLVAPSSSWVNLSTTPIELASTLLINPHDSEHEAHTTVAYRFSETLEMKRLPGMKPGLMADFKMASDEQDDEEGTHLRDILDGRDFVIGMELFRDRGEETAIYAQIPANSKVNVTLHANYQRYRIPYKAIVKAYYKNGNTLTWKDKGSIEFQRMEGLHQRMTEPEPVTDEDLLLEQSHVQLKGREMPLTEAEPIIKLATTQPEVIIMPKTTTTTTDMKSAVKATTFPPEKIIMPETTTRPKQNQTAPPELANDEMPVTKNLDEVVEEVVEDNSNSEEGGEGDPIEEPKLEERMLEVELEPSKPVNKFLPRMSLEEFFNRGSKN